MRWWSLIEVVTVIPTNKEHWQKTAVGNNNNERYVYFPIKGKVKLEKEISESSKPEQLTSARIQINVRTKQVIAR